jgi:hypothetical protein
VTALPLPPESDRPREAQGRIVAVIIVAVVALSAGTAWALSRSPGSAGTPSAVHVVAWSCRGPCRILEPSVTVAWGPPTSGAPVTGYRVLRDGSTIGIAANLGPITSSFIDRDIRLGEPHSYQVIALGVTGDSAPSAPSVIMPPTPPLTLAQLDGIYDVRLTIDRARALGEFLGIVDPVPGEAAKDMWSFDPACAGGRTRCPTIWERQRGLIGPDGLRWQGSVAGPAAHCGAGRTVRAPLRFELRAVAASIEEARWTVRSFRGRVSVSFRCPGFLRSAGTIEVVGSRA